MISWKVTVKVVASQACEMLGAVTVSAAHVAWGRALCSAFKEHLKEEGGRNYLMNFQLTDFLFFILHHLG